MSADGQYHAYVEEVKDEDHYDSVQAESTPNTAEVREVHDIPNEHDETTYRQTDNSTSATHIHTSSPKSAGAFDHFDTTKIANAGFAAIAKAYLPNPGTLISYLPSKAQLSEFKDTAYSKASEVGHWTYENGTDLGGKMYNGGYEMSRNAFNGTADWWSKATENGSEFLAAGSEKVSEMTSDLGETQTGSARSGILSSMVSFASDHPYGLAVAGTVAVGTALLWGRGGKKDKKGKSKAGSSRVSAT